MVLWINKHGRNCLGNPDGNRDNPGSPKRLKLSLADQLIDSDLTMSLGCSAFFDVLLPDAADCNRFVINRFGIGQI
jgi:hypothetical protein